VLSMVESWMFHGNITPAFKINLPLPVGTHPRGVEPRSSSTLGAGNYTMVFTFANNLVSVDGATPASGSMNFGSPAIVVGPNASLGLSANQCQVNLTGVRDQQYVSVALINAKDTTGAIGTVVSPQMGVLIGDIDASGRVDSNDVTIARQNALQPLTTTPSTFRSDVDASGRIDSNDVTVGRQDALDRLSPPP
jgi:hypothetical protein